MQTHPLHHCKLEALVASFGVGLLQLKADEELEMAFKLKKGVEVGRESQGREMIVDDDKIIADMESLCRTLISKPVVSYVFSLLMFH